MRPAAVRERADGRERDRQRGIRDLENLEADFSTNEVGDLADEIDLGRRPVSKPPT
jgi:hypothetical protein